MIKKLILVLLPVSVILFSACGALRNSDAPDQSVELISGVNDDTDTLEYELIILDSRFETFLVTQPSIDYYTQSYLESWNRRYVVEWNIRHSNPLRYGDFYQTRINYDPNEDYGKELNYRLYQYFQFIEREYGIRLIRRRGN